MTTTTLTADVAQDEWTPLVDGDTYESCQIQGSSVQGIALAIADTEPATDSDNYVILSGVDGFLSIALSEGDVVYGRGFNGAGTVRLIQVERAA